MSKALSRPLSLTEKMVQGHWKLNYHRLSWLSVKFGYMIEGLLKRVG